ncbi:TIGR04222 domain-containing membrane protein [Sporichthya sp.]|uniref:TIGR04222 domain-containing membrane protein n=1 Tax=Sporichthya sp. TaxID=65475 RepID=UPI0025D6D677|nr:TIGR04222 domain-containing membrane protein [Sporichthya sp.]
MTGKPLNPEEYGFVMSGPVRAVEVAIAALLERGALRISREGELSATGQPHGLSRLEAEVVEALGTSSRPVPKVIRTVSDGAAVRAIAVAVQERGLGRRRRGFSLRRPVPPSRSMLEDRLAGAGLMPLMAVGAMPLVVAADGFGAYPDEEVAGALLAGKASAVGGVSCSYAWSDAGAGPAGYGPDHVPYVGCSSTGGGFGVGGGGGSSCGSSSGCGGGGGCGGGS